MGKQTRDVLVNGFRIPAPNPEQKREKRRPHAPLRGPGPHRLHLVSGRVRSVPGRVAFGR